MNPVLVLTHNGLEMTKRCVESVRKQDIPTFLFVFDNGSTDGTQEWLESNKIAGVGLNENKGVSHGWNKTLTVMFDGLYGNTDVFEDGKTANHVLVLNNDLILPTFFYRELLNYNLPFVTGRETTTLSDLDLPFEQGELGGGPQFSAFLIRKDAWEKIGPFDESMWGWCSDCDYHIRSHRLGIELTSAPVRYYHERSSTINNAPPKEQRMMQMQADSDRLSFLIKWGFRESGPEYAAQFSPERFGVESK
jgi:GT2 family glycosyltransferase